MALAAFVGRVVADGRTSAFFRGVDADSLKDIVTKR